MQKAGFCLSVQIQIRSNRRLNMFTNSDIGFGHQIPHYDIGIRSREKSKIAAIVEQLSPIVPQAHLPDWTSTTNNWGQLFYNAKP